MFFFPRKSASLRFVSRNAQTVRGILRSACIAASIALAAMPASAPAQNIATGHPDMDPSKVDIFAGYSYWKPYQADIDYHYYQPIQTGAVGSMTVYLNHWLGIQAEGGIHPHGPNDCALTAEGGLVARKTLGRLIPFAHVLGGGVKIGGPVLNPCTWGYGGTAGVGIDYVLHGWSNSIAIRPIQADYQYNRVDYGPLVVPGSYTGGMVKMNTIRLSAGIVFRIGQSSDRDIAQMSCSASPSKGYPGDPIHLSSSTLGIDIHHPAEYTWHTSGGTIEGTGEAVIINTANLAPGDYKVAGTVQQGRGSKGRATCETSFTVKPFEPPTISCSANPSSVAVNEGSTITASGISPQNRPLTYNFTATQGQLSFTGNVATLGTGGVAPGDITVTCTVTDDLGKTATAVTTVNVAAPVAPAAALPVQQELCSIGFDNDKRRPARVDNEAKACLDDVALAMQRESGAQLIVIGEHGLDEGRPTAADRAANVKLYLTAEKGIDSSRIQIRTSEKHAHRVENVLVPAGAGFTMEGTHIIDPATVHYRGQAYGHASSTPARHRSTRRSTRHRSVSPEPAPLYTPPTQ